MVYDNKYFIIRNNIVVIVVIIIVIIITTSMYVCSHMYVTVHHNVPIRKDGISSWKTWKDGDTKQFY